MNAGNVLSFVIPPTESETISKGSATTETFIVVDGLLPSEFVPVYVNVTLFVPVVVFENAVCEY